MILKTWGQLDFFQVLRLSSLWLKHVWFSFLERIFSNRLPLDFTPHSAFPHQSFPYPSWLSVNITFQRMIWSPHFPHTIHPVWMWELDCEESWALKNWCFWTVVLQKTLESPLDCKEIQQFHLKEISPEYSLEGLMLKLKLQSFGHLMQRTDSFEKTPMLGKIEGGKRRGNRGWDGWMASPT